MDGREQFIDYRLDQMTKEIDKLGNKIEKNKDKIGEIEDRVEYNASKIERNKDNTIENKERLHLLADRPRLDFNTFFESLSPIEWLKLVTLVLTVIGSTTVVVDTVMDFGEGIDPQTRSLLQQILEDE